jgi:hypothetical protein
VTIELDPRNPQFKDADITVFMAHEFLSIVGLAELGLSGIVFTIFAIVEFQHAGTNIALVSVSIFL